MGVRSRLRKRLRSASSNLSGRGLFYAFDATGTTNCSGVPKVCSPLWSLNLGGNDGAVLARGRQRRRLRRILRRPPLRLQRQRQPTLDSPSRDPRVVIARGRQRVVYIGSDYGNLYTFDATGTTNCSGVPKTCAPLWTAATGGLDISQSSPAVANGVVYLGSLDGKLYTFDATGTTNCSGVPKTCTPLWTAATSAEIRHSSPAVANGVVYIGSQDHNLYAFTADGTTNCAGTPKACSPLWVAATDAGISSSPTIANGWVYVGSLDDRSLRLHTRTNLRTTDLTSSRFLSGGIGTSRSP